MKQPETKIHTTTPEVGSQKGYRLQYRPKRECAAAEAYAAVTEARIASARPRRVLSIHVDDSE